MQVLHVISNRDNSGGTIAALNLHFSLVEVGYKSSVLSTDKLTGAINGNGYRRFGGIKGRLQNLFLKLENLFARPGFINPTDRLMAQADLKRYDGIVHIHVTHVAQLSFDLLNWIGKNNKVFWTLHDLWPLTAKCIHPTYCNKWQTVCNNCPKLAEYPILNWDNTPFLHKKKQTFIQKHKIHFISPSEWINELTTQHIGELGGQVTTVPHSIDPSIFKPANKTEARKQLNLQEKTLILFPQGRWDDLKKGSMWYLAIKEALMKQTTSHFYLAKIHGNELNLNNITPNVTEISFPVTSDKSVMASYYQLADVSVSLSEVETFGLCVAESLACGTPVIARRANGVNELLAYNDQILANSVEELIKLILTESWRNVNYKPLFEKKYTTIEWAKRHIVLYDQ